MVHSNYFIGYCSFFIEAEGETKDISGLSAQHVADSFKTSRSTWHLPRKLGSSLKRDRGSNTKKKKKSLLGRFSKLVLGEPLVDLV